MDIQTISNQLQSNGYYVRQTNGFYLQAVLFKTVVPEMDEQHWYNATRQAIQTLQDEINETALQCTYAACHLCEYGIRVELVIV